jgi:hypothetical protein
MTDDVGLTSRDRPSNGIPKRSFDLEISNSPQRSTHRGGLVELHLAPCVRALGRPRAAFNNSTRPICYWARHRRPKTSLSSLHVHRLGGCFGFCLFWSRSGRCRHITLPGCCSTLTISKTRTMGTGPKRPMSEAVGSLDHANFGLFDLCDRLTSTKLQIRAQATSV